LKNGFNLNRCGLDFEYYGAGTYLAPDCKLSNRYAAKSETRSILLVRVACGKIFKLPPLHLSLEYQAFLQELGSQQVTMEHRKKLQQNKMRELLRMPKNRSCPDCCHSQLGVDMRGSRKSKTEVVVNRNFQVYLTYRITYRGGALPDPLRRGVTMPSRPLTSTRPLTFTDRHGMCFCNTRVVCTWLVNKTH
jgi:hypothetical protein